MSTSALGSSMASLPSAGPKLTSKILGASSPAPFSNLGPVPDSQPFPRNTNQRPNDDRIQSPRLTLVNETRFAIAVSCAETRKANDESLLLRTGRFSTGL